VVEHLREDIEITCSQMLLMINELEEDLL